MAKNVKILSFVFCFFILVIVGRLFYIQVLKANFFKAQAERNIFKFSYSPGSRGLIFDTKDRLLVINETVFCGTISIPFAKKRWVLEESVNKFKKILLDQLNVEEADVLYDPKSLILRVCDLDFLQAEKLMLLRRELKNFALELQFDRRIIEPEYVSNIIGYQGSNHFGSDFDKFDKNVPRGVFGIEKCLDEFLSGIDGIVRSVVNVKAERVKFETVRAPKHGLHVKLSINLDWQKRAVDLLSTRRGAIVVIEPNTGFVRVLASTPTFNANFFNFRDLKVRSYFDDPNKPLLDRTLNGQYPPGSVIKMLVAVGLTQRGIELSKVVCPGFSMVGNRRINCHKRSGHGSVDLARAITVSCDSYFYELSKLATFEQIVDSLRQFGFGSKTGIDCLPESSGKVPTAEKIKHSLNFEKALLSIGQGTLITTPIQIAVAVSSLFNGGLILKPRLIEEIFSSDRKIVYEMLNPIIISSYDYDEKLADYITRAMFDVVNSPEGTALSSRSNVVSFGGKTGTAQVISLSRKSELPSENFEDHAWFVGYWPHPKPKYVIVVLVENGGSGGKVAAPIAKSFIEYVESS